MKALLSIAITTIAVLALLFGITMVGRGDDRTGVYTLVFGFIFLLIGAILANRNRPPS